MNALVWLDGHKATIFEFSGESVTRHAYQRREPAHAHKDTLKSDKETEEFFHEVAGHLRGTAAFILLGPGIAKQQFVHHLEAHHHGELSKHLESVESTDHPSDEQLIAHGREHFAKHGRSGSAG